MNCRKLEISAVGLNKMRTMMNWETTTLHLYSMIPIHCVRAEKEAVRLTGLVRLLVDWCLQNVNLML
jgi:hypothetical protein